ncbi:MAG TPA: 1-deoxy-D-xylulose-5-phosphate reductoisomerase, partial [Rhodocyclaceae bacterium]
MRTLTVLGSTGSIGRSTLDVVRRHPQRFRIAALCAHRQVDALADQCLEFRPTLAVVGSAEGAAQLQAKLRSAGLATRVAFGPDALREAASLPEVDSVMAAIVGAAGLMPTLAAVEAGKRVLLANKEALVMAGPIFVAAVREHGAVLLPIDSEHNAVFQALPTGYVGEPAAAGIRRILLTASGGPFR